MMNLNDLKSTWKNAGSESFSGQEIEMMTRIGNHPSLKRVRLKLIIEVILLTVLFFAYKDGFDGDKKPLYVNILLGASIVLYVANNIIGFLLLKKPAVRESVKKSLDRQVGRLKRISRFSLISSVLYGISLLAFLTSEIVFDQRKYILLVAVVVAFFLMFYYSCISWKRKIDHFRQLESEF